MSAMQLLVVVVGTVLLAYNLYLLIKEIKEPRGRAQVSINNEPAQKSFNTKQAWTLSETVIAAYASLNYKMSNKDLISFISNVLGREESAVIRKMNRIRGIGTGKSPRASKDDITAYNAISNRTPEYSKKAFDMATDDLYIVGNSYRDFELALSNSVSIK